jgi:hypothetical protein
MKRGLRLMLITSPPFMTPVSGKCYSYYVLTESEIDWTNIANRSDLILEIFHEINLSRIERMGQGIILGDVPDL